MNETWIALRFDYKPPTAHIMYLNYSLFDLFLYKLVDGDSPGSQGEAVAEPEKCVAILFMFKARVCHQHAVVQSQSFKAGSGN